MIGNDLYMLEEGIVSPDKALKQGARNRTRETTVESRPSRNEG